MFFTSIAERALLPGAALSFLMIGLTLLFGRFFCGWVCPLGSAMDLSSSFRREKNELSDTSNRYISKIKYIFLFIILLLAFFGYQTAWVLDPVALAARFTSLNFVPTVTLLTDRLFIFIVRDLGFRGAPYDVYLSLKSGFLGIKTVYFSTAPIILIYFLIAVLSSILLPRLWCRAICPLGAIYSIFAYLSPLSRKAAPLQGENEKSPCRMGAIRSDNSYCKGECILCMDCVKDAPHAEFTFHSPKEKRTEEEKGLSRKDFLIFLAGSVFLMGASSGAKKALKGSLIRPPGVLDEKKFTSRCVRCGNCMKVCPTNVLQPALLESGIEGVWTPRLVNEIGYCEYNCNACGKVCPTGAIPELALSSKKEAKLGIARVDRPICLAWGFKKQCLVCEEHCPVPQKAIKVVEEERVKGEIVGKPLVNPKTCIGCGICQNKCPVRPKRAIRVDPSKRLPA